MLGVALGACAPPPGSGVASGVASGSTPALPAAAVSPAASVPPTAPGRTPAAPAPSAAAEPSLVPSAPAARAYASSADSQKVSPPPADALRTAIVDDARAAARRAGRPPPVADPRLDWAMTDLARNVRGDELPSGEAVDFLLSHYGIVDPSPHVLRAGGTTGVDDQIREQARQAMADLLRAGPIGRLGVGIDRGGGMIRVAVGFQETHVELLGLVPRRLPRGGRAEISARIDPAFREPQLVVTAPDGRVREEAPGPAAKLFHGLFRCGPEDGRYQVEIAATGAAGPAVLANFPVYCGVAPPASATTAAGMRTGPTDPDQAERQMVALVNRDRALAGLPAVDADARLAAIARAHSRDMAEHDFVGHVSPRTGSTMDRVHRAGLAPELVMENVGQAYGPEDAEQGFLGSPGHRGNLLEPRARRIGIGVVFGPAVTGTHPMFVTQLLTN